MSQSMLQTIEFTCPSCRKAIRAPARHAGQAGPCPNCNQRIVVPGVANNAALMKANQDRRRLTTTDPNPAIAVLVGAVAAAALYVVIFLPLREHYLGRLMIDRGPCQYISTFITCWGLATLALKLYQVKQQASYADLELDFIPYDVNMQITPRNVDSFLRHVEAMQADARESILGRRIIGALEHFGARGQVPEVQAYLSSANQVDSSSVESGYTLLKAFIWLVPILGFIGTVTGISDAVSSLSSQFGGEPATASAPADIKGGSPASAKKEAPNDETKPAENPEEDLANKLVKAMGGVTHGLATAFDTTFLGLVCAIMLLFPTEMLRKTEYAMLDRIEIFLNQSLLRRMSDSDQPAPLSPELAKVLEPAFQEHQRWLVKWQMQIGELGDVIGGHLEKHMEVIQRRLAETNAANAESASRATAAYSEGAAALTRTFESWRHAADHIAGEHQRLLEATVKLQDMLQDNSHTLRELIEKCPDRWLAMATALDQFRDATASLQDSLRDGFQRLGEISKGPDNWHSLATALDQLRQATTENSQRLAQMLGDGHALPGAAPLGARKGFFGLWKKA